MRSVLSLSQLSKAFEASEGASFIVTRRIPTGDGSALEEGQDVTAMVRSGEISDSPLRTHVKRGAIVLVPAGAKVRKLTNPTKQVLRQALIVAGIQVPPAASSDALERIREAAAAGSRAA